MTTGADTNLALTIRRVQTKGALILRKVSTLLGAALFQPLGMIFFISHPWISVLLWIALLQTPRYAAFALLGLTVGIGVGKLLRAGEAPKLGGGLKANALLTSVMVAWLTSGAEMSLTAQLVIAIVASAAAAIVAAAIMRVLDSTSLPSLVWGYCLIAAMLFSVCPQCANLAANAMPAMPVPENALSWVAAFIHSLGSLIYSPNYEAGILVGLAILWWSRIMFVTGIIGWVSGACLALAFEKFGITYNWLPVSYNYLIAGMALGSVYFLPGRAGLLIAVAAGGSAAFLGLVLQYILPGSATAYLPIAASATIWVFMGAITLAGDRSIAWLNTTPLLCPENAWWYTAYWSQRFGHKEILFSIPVAGELRISQGVNGLLSHVGEWSFALDFQRPYTIPYSLDPKFNIWSSPVYSPASGVIERIKNTVPDNQLGICNYAENWGNYVVIHLEQGGWALLAHLQQNSIIVKPGMRVEAGDYLGKVGNSGRSPVPHLHLQAQNSPELGARSRPFRLVNYDLTLRTNPQFHNWNAAALPPEGDIIMAANQDRKLHTLLTSIAPGSAVWSIESQGHIPRSFRHDNASNIVRINTTLDNAGQHLFTSNYADGILVAGLMPDAWRIIETRQLKSPLLKLLALAAPSIPYSAKVGIIWNDPVPLLPSGLFGGLTLSIAPYLSNHFTSARCKCIGVPNAEDDLLQIETTLKFSRFAWLLKLTCQFERLRGPVKIQADFKNGSVIYTLLSFEPGLPFKNDDS